MSAEALRRWRLKLDRLLEAEAIETDASVRLRLEVQITEARAKIAELHREHGTSPVMHGKPLASAPGEPASPSTDNGRRFRVALSFPGEYRTLVEPIAHALAGVYGEAKILYDGFHEAEFARPGLAVYLPELYRLHADLVVVVLCPEYAHKRWCRLEWRHIHTLIATSENDRIMFLSAGNPGDLSTLGILSDDGYIDVTDRAPDEVCGLIQTRVAPSLKPTTTAISTVTRESPRSLARLLLSEPNAILQTLGARFGLTTDARESLEGFAERLGVAVDGLGAGPEAAMRLVEACYSALSAVGVRDRPGARRILQRMLAEWLPQRYGCTVVATPLHRTAAPDQVDDLDLDTPNREIAEPAAAFADRRPAAYATRTIVTSDGARRRVVGPRGEIPVSTAAVAAEILTADERADSLAHAIADQIPGPMPTTPTRRLQDTREYLAFLRDPGLEHSPKHISLTADERRFLGEDVLRRLKDILPALRIVGLGERPSAEEARIRFRLLTIFQDDDA